MTDVATEKALDAGLISSALGGNSNAQAVVAQKRRRIYWIDKTAADGMASTATAETASPWANSQFAGNCVEVGFIPTAAITGDAANAFTATLSRRDPTTGANLTTLGTVSSLNSAQGSMAAGQKVAGTLTAANLAVGAGGALTVSIAKNGSGVVVPIGRFYFVIEDT